MGFHTISLTESTDSDLYNPLHNGLVRDASGTFFTVYVDTSDDTHVMSSSDGITWATAHSYTSGARTIYQAKIILDTDGKVHVFATYNNAGTGEIQHLTNRTGAWATSDLTGGAWHVDTEAMKWTNSILTCYDDAATPMAAMGILDTVNDTIRVAILDLSTSPATVDFDEDALNSDSGDTTLDANFTISGLNLANIEKPAVTYNINGQLRVAYRSGVATWVNAGSLTLYPSISRPQIKITASLMTSYGDRYLATHWTDPSTGHRVEIFKYSNLSSYAALSSLGQTLLSDFDGNSASTLPSYGSIASLRNATSSVADDEVGYALSVNHGATYSGIIHTLQTTSQVAPNSTSAHDMYGTALGEDFYSPRCLAHHHDAANVSEVHRAASGLVLVMKEDTGAAADDFFLYTTEGSPLEAGGVTGTPIYTDGASAGDTWVVKSFSTAYTDGASAGDSYNDDGTMRVIHGSGAIGVTKPEYPHYTCLGGYVPEGFAGVSTDTNAYPRYGATGVGDNPNANIGNAIIYPYYTALGTGIGASGGSADIYQTIYDPYIASGVGINGQIGTGSAAYPSYSATGYYLFGSGTAEYPSYTVVATTPGAAVGEATGTGSMSYRAYTISVVALSNYIGTGVATYRAYTATGAGISNSEATAVAAYRAYQALGWGLTGRVATGAAEYPNYTIVAAGMIDDIVGTASMYFPKMYAYGEGTADHLEVFTGRLVDSEGSAFVDGNGDFIVLYDPLPPEFEVVFAAMNLKKQAVTNYHSFDFNSISRNGDNIYAANYNGIYVVGDSDDDDGSDILANVEKVGIDYDSPMRKRATDAYVHLVCGGTYTFSSIANSGRSDQTIADTDTLLHTRKIDLAKGLIGRSLGWALSSSGVSFEIEEIELVVDMGTRRIRRYV